MKLEAHEGELKTLMDRDRELDRLFERLYEDNVSGKISDDRFKKMSLKYEDEQKELTEKMSDLKNLLEDLSAREITTDKFVAAVKKYTRVKKLTARMLNELVERIEVYHAEVIDGVKTQRITIHYNCIGSVEIPDDLPIGVPEIALQTRKGVEISYQPASGVAV